MPYPDASPYQILEISPTAGLPEILKAYPKAIKARRYPPARVTQVFSELRNLRKRAEHDLLFFSRLGDLRAVSEALAALPRYPFVSTTVAPVPLTPSLLQAWAFEDPDDFLPIPDTHADFAQAACAPDPHRVLPPFPYPA